MSLGRPLRVYIPNKLPGGGLVAVLEPHPKNHYSPFLQLTIESLVQQNYNPLEADDQCSVTQTP